MRIRKLIPLSESWKADGQREFNPDVQDLKFNRHSTRRAKLVRKLRTAVSRAIFDKELAGDCESEKVELEGILSRLNSIETEHPEKTGAGWNSPAHDKDPTNM